MASVVKSRLFTGRGWLMALAMLVLSLNLCLIGCAANNSKGAEESQKEEVSLWLHPQAGDTGTAEINGDLDKQTTYQGITFRYSSSWSLRGMDSDDLSSFVGVGFLCCDDNYVDMSFETYTQGETKDLDTYLSLGMDISSDIEVIDSYEQEGLNYWNAYYPAMDEYSPRGYFAVCNDPESGHGYLIAINVYPEAQNDQCYEVLRNFMDNVTYDPAQTTFDSATDDYQEYQQIQAYAHLTNTPPEESAFVQDYLASFGTFDPIVVDGIDDQLVDLPAGESPFIVTFNNHDPNYVDLTLRNNSSRDIFGSISGDEAEPQTLSCWEKTGHGRGGATQLEVSTSGNWHLEINPLNNIQPLVPGKVYEGDQVFYIDTDTLKSLRVTCLDGGTFFDYFRLIIVTPEGNPKEFSQSGPFDVYLDVDVPQCVLKVTASGRWSIAWDTETHAGTSSSTGSNGSDFSGVNTDLDRKTLIDLMTGKS